jgi:hypothetical protein
MTPALHITDLATVHSTMSTCLYIINFLKHCISLTVFQTHDTDLTQQIGVVNKQFLLQKIASDGVFVFVLDGECLCLCWMVSLCVCVSQG